MLSEQVEVARCRGETVSPSELAVVAHVHDHYVVARWQNVFLTYWLRQGTVRAVQDVDALLGQADDTTNLKISCVHLIKDGAGLPDHDTRLAVRALHDRHGQRIACLGIVLLGDGFWASALQSVFTALRLVGAPRPSLMRFARSTAELAAWLRAEHVVRTGVRIDEHEVLAVMNRVLEVGNAPPALAS